MLQMSMNLILFVNNHNELSPYHCSYLEQTNSWATLKTHLNPYNTTTPPLGPVGTPSPGWGRPPASRGIPGLYVWRWCPSSVTLDQTQLQTSEHLKFQHSFSILHILAELTYPVHQYHKQDAGQSADFKWFLHPTPFRFRQLAVSGNRNFNAWNGESIFNQ